MQLPKTCLFVCNMFTVLDVLGCIEWKMLDMQGRFSPLGLDLPVCLVQLNYFQLFASEKLSGEDE